MRMIAAMLMAGLLLEQAPEPVRVSVRLVQVNVIVRNRAGESVTGLSKDDFEITDNGKGQEISFFEAENAEEAKRPAALAENRFSNRMDAGGKASPGVTVVLFDWLNTSFEDQVSAKDRLVRVLRQIQPNQRIGVYLLGRELMILHDFTDSPIQLAAVLGQLEGQTSHALSGAQEEPLPKPVETKMTQGRLEDAVNLMNGMQNVSKDYFNVDRVAVTLNAIVSIANHLASTTGRKNLIWVSGSFPFTLGVTDKDLENMKKDSPNRQRGSFEGPFERTMRAVSNANMAIYPVDARGLMALPDYDAGTNTGKPANKAPKMATMQVGHTDTMENLASKSGGQVFFNTNDLGKAIRTALEDGRMTYTLGFYPESAADNKFHTLKVQVRRKDVTLRYRQGYLAAEGPANTDPTLILRELVTSPLDATDIGISVKLEASPVKDEAWTVNSIVDAHDLAMENRAGKWVGQLQVAYSVQNEAGKELGGLRDEVALELKPEAWKEIQTNGLALQKKFTPPANAATMRIAVYDPGSGRSGSVSVPLKAK